VSRTSGKVVTVEKTRKKDEKKEDEDSMSSTLVPGIGVTQQLFATTGFLDAPDNKQEEVRKTDGSDNASLKSPNLLANTDDEQDKTVLERDHTTVGTNTKEVEGPGDGRKRAWWVACTSCEKFPCVCDQYGKSARENDGVLNLMIGSHTSLL
jgi:hypothetical protein